MLKAIPMSQREAAAWIHERHRHLPKTNGDMWRVACIDGGGKIVGVITVGRPLARSYDYRKVCQVLRCCTDGTENACSFLYGKASRIAKELKRGISNEETRTAAEVHPLAGDHTG